MSPIPPPQAAQLQRAVRSWVDLPPAEWHQFLSIFRQRSADARQHIMHPGDDSHELIFCCQGVLRFYYLGSLRFCVVKGKVIENTKCQKA